MTIKYFTGCNLDTRNTKASGDVKTYPTSRSGKTLQDLTSMGLAETEPADNADGTDPKPDRTVDSATAAKYVRIRRKVYSKTGDTIGKSFANNVGCRQSRGTTKSRVSMLTGKYEQGKMWKYRKTLKRLFTATGFAAQASSIGERNMFNGKNNGRVGNYKTASGGATEYPLYPLNALK